MTILVWLITPGIIAFIAHCSLQMLLSQLSQRTLYGSQKPIPPVLDHTNMKKSTGTFGTQKKGETEKRKEIDVDKVQLSLLLLQRVLLTLPTNHSQLVLCPNGPAPITRASHPIPPPAATCLPAISLITTLHSLSSFIWIPLSLGYSTSCCFSPAIRSGN